MDKELREKLADVQHAIWSHWMDYLFNQCQEYPDGSMMIPAEKALHWQRQLNTPYAELTEREKDSDRDQADKVLEVL